MTLEQLLADLNAAGVATLDTGGQISAAEARRLACGANIIPAVLGGKSEVLDIGRQRRFHTKAQRIAMTLRDQGCTAVDCDRPPAMTHAITTSPGHTAAPPTCRTAACSAATTTDASTTTATA